MTDESTTHKLFTVPELLTIICDYSGCRRSPHLLRISRAFFLAGLSSIWEEVVGVHNLLNLLPGVSFEVKEDTSEPKLSNSQKAFSIVVQPELAEAATDFTRFDLYAQSVKRLKIYSPAVSSYQVNGNDWRQLSEQAKRRDLLPNLLELNIAPPRSSGGQIIFMWIRTFLSPSLTSIVVEALPPEASLPVVPSLVAKSLLGHIEKTCHGLQHLQLFSETGVPENYDASSGRNDFGIVEFWEPSFFERLTGLRLRKLGCTIELISPKWIHLLSEFPLLKGLDLYTAYPSVPAFADSRPAFLPCLEHFGIHFTICDEIEKVANLGFLDGLKSLRISFRECRTFLEDGWERDTILLISRNSPGLTKLYMDFEGTADTAPEMSSFRPLGALPITEVYLQGSVYMEENELEDLGVIWPKVTRFEMRNWSEGMELGELRHFTKLPCIQHLILVVSWQDGIPQSIAPAKPSYTLQTFEVSTNGFYADFDVSLLAQYMLSLWPNLESVYWPRTDDQSNITMEAMNNMIASQRTLNRLKSRIVEECGLDMLDKLMK